MADNNKTLRDAAQQIPELQTAVEKDQSVLDQTNTRKQAILQKIADDEAVLKTKQDEQTALQQKADETGNVQDGTNAVNAGSIVVSQQSTIIGDQSQLLAVNGDLDNATYNLKTAQTDLDQWKQRQSAAIVEGNLLSLWSKDVIKRGATMVRNKQGIWSNNQSTLSVQVQRGISIIQLHNIRFTRGAPVYSKPIASQVYLLGRLNVGTVTSVIRCSNGWLMMVDLSGVLRWVPSS